MEDIDALNRRFSIPGTVEIARDDHGLGRLTISTAAAAAIVYLHGAHVTHYQHRGFPPVLFTSAESRFEPAQPIRGGVPVIFPWFGPHPTDPRLPAHGFARVREWGLRELHRVDDSVRVVLTLTDVAPFELLYTVSIGRTLELSLEVRNTSGAPVTFEEALHTYLAVGDVRRVRVEGLHGREYLDKVDGRKRKAQSGAVTITGETDRVYLNTPDTVTVHDAAGNRRISVAKEGSSSTVVWNPWTEKAKKMADFGDDEWPRMLCVETANVAENAVTLAPGATHTMRAVVRVE
jgi:glucose-6-phosphate 1-epimerase